MNNYYLVIDGKRKGPYTAERIQGMWAQSHIAKGTPCLKEGESQPRPIEAIREITSPRTQPAPATTAASVSAVDVKAMMQANWKYILPAGASLLLISLLVIFLAGGPKKKGPERFALGNRNNTTGTNATVPLIDPDPGIAGDPPDANQTLTNGPAQPVSFPGVGPTPPKMVPGKDFEYSLGKLEIVTYGTELPENEKKYFREKADELIQQFEDSTGFKPPKGFYYQVYYYKDRNQFAQVTGKDPNRLGGITYWNYTTANKIAPIHCHGGFQTVLHEMVHGITWPAYGDMPLFMVEGFAEWVAYEFLFKRTQKKNYDLPSKVNFLAQMIRANRLPSLNDYLQSQTYIQWRGMFGQISIGYGAAVLLVDYLLAIDKKWTHRALEYSGKAGPTRRQRTLAFYQYAKDKWPGGLLAMEKGWQGWILKKEKELKNPPGTNYATE